MQRRKRRTTPPVVGAVVNFREVHIAVSREGGGAVTGVWRGDSQVALQEAGVISTLRQEAGAISMHLKAPEGLVVEEKESLPEGLR
jgi:hypothetical protein